jgi:ATP-dependent DNA ligase
MSQMRTSEPDECQLMFLVFDLLHQDDVDLRGLPQRSESAICMVCTSRRECRS